MRWQERDGGAALDAGAASERAARDARRRRRAASGSRASRRSGAARDRVLALAALPGDRAARASCRRRDAGQLGVENGDEIELSVEGERDEAAAAVRSAVPDGSVFVTGVALPDGPVAIRPARAGAAVA